MGFQQGLSGLNAQAKNLDVIGNNVANANTVGFKMSKAQFSDIYAAAAAGTNGDPGVGTKLATVAQQFSQGNITTSNNPLDTAISGPGFFQLGDSTSPSPQYYTRNGQFQMDNQGYIVTSEGKKLFGMDKNGAPGPLQVPTAPIPARATGTSDHPNVMVGLNLDAGSAVTALPADQGESATVPPAPAGSFRFNPNDPTTYNNSTSTTIYDSLGNPHVSTLFFQKAPATSSTNPWNVYLTIDNELQPPSATPTVPASAVPMGTNLVFDSTGKLPPGTLLAMATPYSPPFSVPAGGGSAAAANPISLTFDFSESTQYGSPFGVNTLSQDGYTTGMPSGFNISPNGTILGRYTNGQTQKLGQVTISNFANPQGLQPLGNNRWAPTEAAGTPLSGPPGSASLGVLQSGAVEDANVDLTGELVNMIVAQRGYQANAQTIKTQDSVLQTITNLR